MEVAQIQPHLSGALVEQHWSARLQAPNGCWLSPCRGYQYLLWRSLAPVEPLAAAPMMFVMLHPSDSDHTKDNPTIRRCMAIAARERTGGIIVVNLTPYRTSTPSDLTDAYEAGIPMQRRNHTTDAINLALQLSSITVVAWGASVPRWMGSHALRIGQQLHNRRVHCLGLTKDGEPRHPLFVKGDAPLVRY